MAETKEMRVKQAIANLATAQELVKASRAYTKALPSPSVPGNGAKGHAGVLAMVFEELTEQRLSLAIQELSFMLLQGQRFADLIHHGGHAVFLKLLERCGVSLDYAIELIAFAALYDDERLGQLCSGKPKASVSTASGASKSQRTS